MIVIILAPLIRVHNGWFGINSSCFWLFYCCVDYFWWLWTHWSWYYDCMMILLIINLRICVRFMINLKYDFIWCIIYNDGFWYYYDVLNIIRASGIEILINYVIYNVIFEIVIDLQMLQFLCDLLGTFGNTPKFCWKNCEFIW